MGLFKMGLLETIRGEAMMKWSEKVKNLWYTIQASRRRRLQKLLGNTKVPRSPQKARKKMARLKRLSTT